jgi:CII-binding regulator of phage lambda lysogenization HflD
VAAVVNEAKPPKTLAELFALVLPLLAVAGEMAEVKREMAEMKERIEGLNEVLGLLNEANEMVVAEVSKLMDTAGPHQSDSMQHGQALVASELVMDAGVVAILAAAIQRARAVAGHGPDAELARVVAS